MPSIWDEADAVLQAPPPRKPLPPASSVWDEADQVLSAPPAADELTRSVIASSPATLSRTKPTIESLLGTPAPPTLEATPLPPAAAVSKPGEIERQQAWSLSPARDRAAARAHQPPVNTETAFGRAAREGTDPAAAAWQRGTPGVDNVNDPTLMQDFEQLPVLSAPFTGAKQLATGVSGLARAAGRTLTAPSPEPSALPPPRTGTRAWMQGGAPPSEAPLLAPDTMNAASDTLEGAMQILEPALVVAIGATPLRTIAALVGSVGAAKATQMVSQKAQLTPELTRLLTNVTGAVAAGATVPMLRSGFESAAEWGRGRVEAAANRGRITPEPTDIEASVVRQPAGALPEGPGPAEPLGEVREAPVPAAPARSPDVWAEADHLLDVEPAKARVEDLIAQVNGGTNAAEEQAPGALDVREPSGDGGPMGPRDAGGDQLPAGASAVAPPQEEEAASGERVQTPIAPPPDLHVRRELGRMAAELEAMPFTKRGFVDPGRGRGGDLEVVPGGAGAPVYDDILQASPGTSRYTRAQVAAALRKYLATGTSTNPVVGALEVAKARFGGLRQLGSQPLSKPQLPPEAGNEPGKLYVERKRTLSPELEPVRERAAAAVETEPAAIVDRYVQKFGNVVGSDQAKELFPDYEANRTTHSTAVHEASQTIAQAVYDKLVSEPVPAGKDPIVVFTAGGTGSGKTTGVDLVAPNAKQFAHVIYDSTLTDPALAFRNIDKALETGHDVAIVYTYRPLEQSFERGVLPRAMAEGRTVRIDAHVRTHIRALNTIQRIQERYAKQPPNEPRVDILVVDNSGARGEAKLSDLEALRAVRYTKADATAALSTLLEREHQAGRISPELYAATQVGRPAEVPEAVRTGSAEPARPREAAPEKVDTLDTGEHQPRLPEAGAVREREQPTPELEVPFSLTPEAEQRGTVQEPLFRAKPARGGGRSAAMRIPEQPQASARGVARAVVVPGLEEFVEQDVVPGAKESVEQLAAAGSDIKTLFAPASASTAARDFSHVVRANIAARDQRLERARRQTKAMADRFDRQLRGATTPAAKADVLLAFADAVEGGEVKTLPAEERAAAKTFAGLYAERKRQIAELGLVREWLSNYFPHEWKDPTAAAGFLKQLFGKRPLQGPKHFLKQRTIPTTRAGIERGLVPASYNPVELTLRKLLEMDKFITATRILQEGVKTIPGMALGDVGAPVPEGSRRFDHSFATVYGPPVVRIQEAYDRILVDKLQAFVTSLNVPHERTAKIGGSRWGYAEKMGSKMRIVTKFAGPETVLEHEIGHVLEWRYGLFREITQPAPRETHTFTKGKRKGQTVRRAVKQDPMTVKERQRVKAELRALADLRDEGVRPDQIPESRRQYVRDLDEQIANLIHAFIYNPERTKEVAPTAYWRLYNFAKKTPELEPLIDLQKARSLTLTAAATEIPVGGAVIKGYYYGPPEVVRLLDNHLAPGLRSSTTFNLYRRAGNFLNQVQLGLSAFHLSMTGMESVISKQSLAFEFLARGRVGEALRAQLEVPVSPLVDLRRGHKALKQFYLEDANAQTFNSIIDSVVQGGGGFGWSLFEHEGAPAKFMQALRQGNYPGAALRAVPALVELQAKPIMEGWVPRLKMAAFLDLMRLELPTLGPHPNLSELRRVAGEAWDSVDNRFGQLRYDNLFWHTALKDLGMASVRALGWNVGNVREAAGAPGAQLRQVGLLSGGGYGGKGGRGRRPTRLVDVGVGPDGEPRFDEAKEPWLHRKVSWIVANVLIYGLAGAIYLYLHTGDRPKELKDYFFPRNGDGDTRVSIPGYPKDWYSVGHALPGSAVDTAKHKVNPLLTLLLDLFSNRDYLGTSIRDPHDPLSQQLRDVVGHMVESLKPISVANFTERKADELATGKRAGVNAVESFFGINRAPSTVTRTAAESLVREFLPPSGRTKEQAEQAQRRSEIRKGLQAGTPEGRALARSAARSGALSSKQVDTAVRQSRLTYLQNAVKQLSLEQAIQVYEVATPEERRELSIILRNKAANVQSIPANRKASLAARYRAALALPASKPAPEATFR